MRNEIESILVNQPGYLGMDSAKGITISYWKNEQALRNWRQQSTHQIAQKQGIKRWYQSYEIQICKVERTYRFNRNEGKQDNE
ncbi:antibiotic biosynthesis monooxygenase [Hazenella sp. IB182353]|uniref:antibiotic biosynthesis monooxygenase family protein n=1 Tax=Polycladospora coralii TaxID=2771432 RepID=UPI0017479BD9|nr:antibiotic biosynthesis monooxygenase [Polycladospora coralii]MBS7530031.1 antibiotic biosynthesis monooxygenase [Polycladospora coralii]